MHKSLGLVLFASISAYAYASTPTHFDPPDLNFEYQLHRQYLISRGEQPHSTKGLIESYQLQSGENLWGLSQMLYGDGNYWPKVWAQNKSITNPHLIRPGYTLHFQMGSEDDTPSFRFSEAEEEGGVELTAASGGSSPQVEIPPPETPPRPIIAVPKSFPNWQSVYRKQPDQIQIDDSKMIRQRYVPPDRLPLSAYVQDMPIDAMGSFMEIERESGLPLEGQHVYVKIKKGTGQVGQKYLIVKDMGIIPKLNAQVEGDINAHYIQVYGDLVLTDTAPATFHRSRDRENFEAFRAKLVHTTNLTLTGFHLIPGEVQIVDLSKEGPEGTAQAQILGSHKHEASALYGIGDIIFLNKGAKDGVAVGQIFDIYIDRTIRDEATAVAFAAVSSGKVKVVKTADTVSTAVILKAVDSIQQGDRVQAKMNSVTDEDTTFKPRESLRFDMPAPE